MFWRRGEHEVSLCYSMNVHPGEGLDDVLRDLSETVVPLKRRLGVEGRFAVGLRLANRAAEEAVARIEELQVALQSEQLIAITVNAFPFGDFHAARVKEEVYRPDWSHASRAVYSLRAAVALAAVNKKGTKVSVSTVPLSYKEWAPSLNAVTNRVLDMITAYQGVDRKSVVRPMLALEPEPFCLLETARETVDYWRNHLMPAARAKYGRGAEELVRTYLGVCFDTCHHAVRWEDGAEAIDLYRDAGIPIAKAQLSSALEADGTAALAPFAEERYLHQVVAEDGRALHDLGTGELEGRVRCHFHVPIHKDEVAGVATTRADMLASTRHLLATEATNCLEIETYTWDVLPLREGDLLDSLEAEYRCVIDELETAGYATAL